MECLFCSRKFPGYYKLQIHYQKHTLERPYFCPKCPQELGTKNSLNYHLETHRPQEDRRIECHICGKFMMGKRMLRIHIKYHVEGRKFACKTCGKRYAHPQSLKCHEDKHKNRKVFVCNVCGRACSTKSELKKHEEGVHGEKRHSCHICGRKFSLKTYLEKHLNTHAPLRESFHCDKCSKSFLRKQSYQEHRQIHEGQQHSFECDKCGERFLNRAKMKAHKKHVHLESSRIFTCVFCNKQFPLLCRLNRHLADHTNERPSFCKRCPAEFKNNQALRSHNQMAHSQIREKLNCVFCPKLFLSKQGLNNHLKIHLGELSIKCQSPGCGMQFSSYDRRRLHNLKVHVGKQFSCAICRKKFLTKQGLRSHTLVHTNLRGYRCDLCGLSFTHVSNFYRHRRTVHAN